MTDNTPKVSVLMLTYNQERYIDQAISSVMNQKTDFEFELVIGNDASTDRTGEYCRAWQEKYPRRIVLLNREKNLGLQQNFLQTYALCKGKYIAICEGDDFWIALDKLQLQADFLDKNSDYSTCFHRVVNYYEDKGTKSLSNGNQQIDTDIIDLARGNYISNVSALFRRNLFGQLPEWFAKVSTYDYAIHLLNAQYGKIHYMPRPMAVYRQHGRAIWSEAGMDKKLDIALSIRELLMDYFEPKSSTVYDALRMAHSNICINLIRYYTRSNNEAGIAHAQQRLLRYRPELTLTDVVEMQQPPRLTLSQKVQRGVSKALSTGRAVVSWFIPVPKGC